MALVGTFVGCIALPAGAFEHIVDFGGVQWKASCTVCSPVAHCSIYSSTHAFGAEVEQISITGSSHSLLLRSGSLTMCQGDFR